jgi:hypothetical protein
MFGIPTIQYSSDRNIVTPTASDQTLQDFGVGGYPSPVTSNSTPASASRAT